MRKGKMQWVTVALEWFLNPDHLPIVAAKEKGFFLEEGLELSILIPTVPEESLDLVAHGKADFGVGERGSQAGAEAGARGGDWLHSPGCSSQAGAAQDPRVRAVR